MFGFRFIKVQPTTYLLQYSNGVLKREGAGLSFFYYAPTTSLVAVSVASVDVPFIFEEQTADFQTVTIQGQMTYRITQPKQIAQLMNFALDPQGRTYLSDDPTKLPQRLISPLQVLTRAELQQLSLRDALRASDSLVESILPALRSSDVAAALGLEILGLSILAVKASPEIARALEAEARERLLREADQAIYARRNAAVEQERAIKENEFNTEIAIENKKRQVREAQMDAEAAVEEKRRQLKEAGVKGQISLERQKQELVELSSRNAREEADSKAYAMNAMIRPLAELNPKVLQALASMGMDSRQMIARAFQEIAENAGKVGQLNLSPDLLQSLLGESSDHGTKK